MGVGRRVIFPIIRIVIWGVIAVALCAIAFGDDGVPQSDGDTPQAPTISFSDPTITTERRTITNEFTITGAIVEVEATDVPAPTTGNAFYFSVPGGEFVREGQPIMAIRTFEEQEPIESTDDEGVVTTTPQAPIQRETTVMSPRSGVVSFEIERGDDVAEGDVVATINPQITYIAADVPPEHLYRLLEPPETATITIRNGPEPFECTDLRLESAATDEGPGTELRCDVPDGVRVFPGLELRVTITSEAAEDALALPITAVRGTVDSGSVWVVDAASGEQVQTPVQLGINDGEYVHILDGLEEGDEVLQFVPGSDAQFPDDATDEEGRPVDDEGNIVEEDVEDDGSGEEFEELDDGSGDDGSGDGGEG